jgi:hypothetical protein
MRLTPLALGQHQYKNTSSPETSAIPGPPSVLGHQSYNVYELVLCVLVVLLSSNATITIALLARTNFSRKITQKKIARTIMLCLGILIGVLVIWPC